MIVARQTLAAGRTTLGPFPADADWSAFTGEIDLSQVTVFPVWVAVEISRDDAKTWEELIRFDVTGFDPIDKFTGLPSDKVARFSRRTIKSAYKVGALVRVHLDSPAAVEIGAGLVNIDDSGLAIAPHSSIALVTGQALAADTGNVGGTTLATGNFPSAVTAGNLICSNSGNDSSGGGTTTGITDTPGNTYTVNQASANNVTAAQRIDAHYAKNILGGTCSVTATFSASVVFRHVHASEYSGAETAAPLDQSLGGTGNGTPSSGNVTTTTNGQLIYGCEGNASTGAGSGFTPLAAGANYDNRSEYQIQSVAGAIAAAFTGLEQYCACVMTFKAAAAGGLASRGGPRSLARGLGR